MKTSLWKLKEILMILCETFIVVCKNNQLQSTKEKCNLKRFWEQHGTDKVSYMTFFVKNMSLMLINHHNQQLDRLFNKEQH
jgi:hypothetical protein